jgi:hypothetical protein
VRIEDAQWEMRTWYVGGFYGQLVSGLLWLVSASLAKWDGPRAAIITLVLGGFFIFPVTEMLLRATGERTSLSASNSLRELGMQTAFVLPLSMPLLVPVGLYRLTWFYPAMMILLGAHYLPFAFLDGMRLFLVLAPLLTSGGGHNRDVLVEQLQHRCLVHRLDPPDICGCGMGGRGTRVSVRCRPTTACNRWRRAPWLMPGDRLIYK